MSKKRINESLVKRFIEQVKDIIDNREKAMRLVKSISARDKVLGELIRKLSDSMTNLTNHLEKMNKESK